MLRTRGIAVRCTLVLAVVFAATFVWAIPAKADYCSARCQDGDGGSSGEGEVSTEGGTVEVEVTSRNVRLGSDGSSGGSYSTTVSVTPACHYARGPTGKDYYKFWKSVGFEVWGPPGMRKKPDTPPPGLKKHKNAGKKAGRWYIDVCLPSLYRGPEGTFLEYADEWLETHHPVWVGQDESEPVAPVPPEVLLQAAREVMELPEPEVSWNPKLDGSNGTLVNLQTWFWLEDPAPAQGQVTASAGGNSITVELRRTSMVVSAPATTQECGGTGVAWSRGAESDCMVRFVRASAPGGATEVTVETQWELSWTANGQPQGGLEPMSPESTVQIPVFEAQTVVTDVS